MCRLLNLTNVEDSGCTSLRAHLGSLLASGPALALVLHLPVKCLAWNFAAESFHAKKGICVSWVPLGVQRV